MAKDKNKEERRDPEAQAPVKAKIESKETFATSHLLRKYGLRAVQAPYALGINSMTEEDFLSKKKKFEGGE